ncbi:MAG TPA: DUF3800 domain-containing protein, partial [bacterium]|nr:DUF3800 domain-containing protein [bacterium]
MAVEAYIDDSGSSARDITFALAGFVANVEAWALFSKAWQTVLDGPPKLDYFKMHEAFRRSGQFSGWTEDAIQRRLMQLVDLIRSGGLIRVHCTMHRADYNATIKGKADSRIDDPYFPCFYQVLVAVIKFQIQNQWTQKIDFVFDEHGGVGHRTVLWYDAFKKAYPKESRTYLSGPPIFRDDKKFLPLQAADLYAGQIKEFTRLNRVVMSP